MAKLQDRTVPYREDLLKSLTRPEDAAHCLNACLEEEAARVFLLALRDVADAHGGIGALSRDTQLKRRGRRIA